MESREKRGEAGGKALAKHTRLNLTHPLAVCWVFQDGEGAYKSRRLLTDTHSILLSVPNFLSLALAPARPPRQLSSSPAHYLSSPPSRQYCIVLKPRLVLRLDKSRRTTYLGAYSVSSSLLAPSIPPLVILPPHRPARAAPRGAAESRTCCIIHEVI